jgi:hypothetical protein
MNKHRVTYVGHRYTWGGTQPFGLSHADRLQHLYSVGKSGTGKSTLLLNLAIHDIEAGEAVAVIDPHGDLCLDLLDAIPPWRSRDVVYFDAADTEFPIALNLLHGRGREAIHVTTSRIVSAIKSVFSESWGPRLEYVLTASIAALAECENTTLLGVPRMLVDERYREWVVGQVTDPAVRAYWQSEFAGYDKHFAAEVVSPVQNKLGAFFLSAPLRQILGQVRCSIDPRFLMDHKKIFIANLSKGRIGEDKAKLLGALLVAELGQAALSRADAAEEDRPDFFLFVDEFQNFITDSFASMLSETRKYHTSISLFNQYLDQTREDIRNAILGNVGSIIAFRVGANDARLLEREFGYAFPASQFTDLANHEVLVKLLVHGENREPFRGRTLPPQGHIYGRGEKLIRASRERYGTPRHVVEDKISRWMRARY